MPRPDRIGPQPELHGFHSLEGLEAYTRDLEYLAELASCEQDLSDDEHDAYQRRADAPESQKG